MAVITIDGQEGFVIDGHMHFWGGSPQNWRHQWGGAWIKCVSDYHLAPSPKEAVWPF